MMKFYLASALNPAEPSVGLVSKNLKSIMYVALNTTGKKFLKFYNSPYVLELLHIHSFQKGEGRKLIVAFIELQKSKLAFQVRYGQFSMKLYLIDSTEFDTRGYS